MASTNRHTIQRQTVLLDTRSSDPPFALQERMSVYCRQQLPTILEKIFDQLADADTTIRLDELTIDAGLLSVNNLEEELTRQIIRQIENVFDGNSEGSDRFGNSSSDSHSSGSFRRLSRNDRLREQLLYFLQRGRMPVWSGSSQLDETDDWLRTPEAASFRMELKRLLRTETRLLSRFIGHSSDETLISLAFPADEPVKNTDVRLLFAATRLLTAQSADWLREQYWRVVLTEAVQKEGITFYDCIRLFQPVVVPALSLVNFVTQLLTRLQSSPEILPGSDRLVRLLTQWLDNIPLSQDHSAAIWSGSEPEMLNLPAPSPKVIRQQPDGESVNNAENKIFPSNLPLPATGQVTGDPANQSYVPPVSSHPQPAEPLSGSGRRSEQAESQEALYVPLAGVVLLHPFLSTVFTEMGLLTTNRQWIDEQAAGRGVQVLAHLATGQDYCPEYDMPLLKLLCGLPLETVVSPYLLPTDTDRQLTTELLDAVIGHWTALGTISADGLREAFLKREGKLSVGDKGWRLTVERKTLDILLGRLPWGFTMIKLPFMTDLLFVDWN